MPTAPPFKLHSIVRFLGAHGERLPVQGIHSGALATVISNELGHQGTGELIFRDEHGELRDVSVDGYSVVRFDGGQVASITAASAKYFEVVR
jgi:hypothetical protein